MPLALMLRPRMAQQTASPRSAASATLLPPLSLSRESTVPLQRQLYDQIREVILAGRLTPGARLPSSRDLAVELGCSRNTVVSAFEQLFSEGYLEGQVGAGTYVSKVLPEELLGPGETTTQAYGARPAKCAGARADARHLSARGQTLAELREKTSGSLRPFQSGAPDIGHFPFDIWGRLLGRTWRRGAHLWSRPGSAAGHAPLRAAIAGYLRAVRAVRCEADQVILTSGGQQAIDLAARCLLDAGDRVWIEDPGYLGLRGPLLAAGAALTAIPVDGEGLSLDAALAREPRAKMAVITPSHQYPIGVTMSLARRLAFLDWARAGGAWILEDDYDSEFRYAGRPLASLQGLDEDDCVLYIGTFSKVMFPSLRLGYLVVPPGLVEPLVRARAALDDHPSMVAQPALAAFMEEGHFAAHIRRMRKIYSERRRALIAAAERHFTGLLDLTPDEGGLHMIARLAPDLAVRMDDREASQRAAAAGIAAPPLSSYYLGSLRKQGLMLGFAAFDEDAIETAAVTLADALR